MFLDILIIFSVWQGCGLVNPCKLQMVHPLTHIDSLGNFLSSVAKVVSGSGDALVGDNETTHVDQA